MADRYGQVNIEAESGEYTLEAILAEYKSEAFLKNERRLSREELEKQAEAIIREMRRSVESELEEERRAKDMTAGSEPEAGLDESAASREEGGGSEAEARDDRGDGAASSASDAAETEAGEPAESSDRIKAPYISRLPLSSPPGGKGELYAAADAASSRAAEIERALKKEELSRARAEARGLKAEKRAERRAARLAKAEEERKRREDRPEMSVGEALDFYASGIPSLKRRTAIVCAACAVMIFLLISESSGLEIPLILPRDRLRQAMAFLIIQLFTMLLGIDILVAGVEDAFRGRLSPASLAASSCLASLLDAVTLIIERADWVGQPYCAAASCVLLFNMFGARLGRSAWRATLRTLKAAGLPTAVSADGDRVEEGTVLFRRLGGAAGFVNRCGETGLAERAYAKLAPLLIAASIVFALVADAVNGGRTFFHCLAGLTAVSASLTAALVFSRPFSATARRLADYGAAIAGWSGAVEIKNALGIVIRDLDLFPENTVTLNGLKVLSNASYEKVISYTGSLILASGSGLSRIFGELLREYACSIYRVEEFSCYEGGGIGALIKGDAVLVGTPAFMNLMGIRVPPNLDVAGAVYSAIDGELSGVFIINYTPVDIVQNALVTLIRSDITPLFAVRDFNVSPAMLKNKFRISADKISFLPFTDRYALSSDSEGFAGGAKPAAIMGREGLGHFVEIALAGRRLVKTVKRSLVLTAAGSVSGLLLVFFALARSAFASASAGNVLAFMALWAAAVLLLSDAAAEK